MSSRLTRLTPITLTSYAAYLLLSACSDGGEGSAIDPGGNTGGFGSPSGGAHSSAGATTSPQAGHTSVGGASSTAGSGGTAGIATTAGASTGGAATGGATTGGVSTGGAATGGAANGGAATAGATSGGSGGVGGMSSGGAGGMSGAGGGTNPPCGNGGQIQCSGSCVDPKTSEQHCGGCGKACISGQQCESGKCECSGDLDLCSNACVDTKTDEANCGGCGTKCSSGQTCESGKCTGGSTGSTCSSITDFGTVSATIVVKGGQTYDGQCRRYRADASKLGDGSQKEGQKPVFIVEDGGKLINVVLGAPAADGIHTEGDATLENITWEDIGEDAMTIKEGGTVILNGGSAKNGDDKVFQINAASTFRVSNFKASNAGKFIRQNGGTTFKTQVYIDKCDISAMEESIFRTDSSTSTVSLTNTRYHDIGDDLFIGVSSGNITQSNNTEY